MRVSEWMVMKVSEVEDNKWGRERACEWISEWGSWPAAHFSGSVWVDTRNPNSLILILCSLNNYSLLQLSSAHTHLLIFSQWLPVILPHTEYHLTLISSSWFTPPPPVLRLLHFFCITIISPSFPVSHLSHSVFHFSHCPTFFSPNYIHTIPSTQLTLFHTLLAHFSPLRHPLARTHTPS